MKGTRPLSAFNAALTWLLAGLMAEPQANLLGQQVSPYERALEILIAQVAPTEPLPARPVQQAAPNAIPLLSQPVAAAPPPASPLAQAASAGADTNLLLSLARTPVTLTNGNQLLALSFFSDSNHNYVVEFRDELGLDLCNTWQPLTNAPHNYGIVFTEANITNRFYRLRRIDVPRSPLFALLANDTGTNSLDGLTSDPTIMGMALRFPAGTTLHGSLEHPGGPFVAITNLGAPRHFVLTREMLNSIQGGPLSDGSHTLYLRAENSGQTLATFDLPFTLDTTPPVVSVALAPGFDSPPLGDGRTSFNPVTMNGQTEPGARLELLAATPPTPGGSSGWVIHTILPDDTGAFALTNVVLAEGTNQFYFRALDAACNETNTLAQLCWYGPDCTFPDNLDGWHTFAAPTAGTPGVVSIAPDKSCAAVLTEGDSFLVTLSRDFVVPTLPSTLNITYSQLSFDSTTAGAMRDAFEVALVDAAGRPLTYTIQGTNSVTPASVSTPPVLPPSPDACFNHSDGSSPFHAIGTAHFADPLNSESRVLAIDVAHLPPGTVARLILRLVNNDRDRATTVRISKAGFDSSARALNFGGTLPVALSVIPPRRSTQVTPESRTDGLCSPFAAVPATTPKIVQGVATSKNQSVTIDFENIPEGTLLREHLVPLGLRISGAGNVSGLVFLVGQADIKPFGNSGTHVVHAGRHGQPTTFTFVDPQNETNVFGVRDVSFLMGNGDPNLETFSVAFHSVAGDLLSAPTVYSTTTNGLQISATSDALGGLIGGVTVTLLPTSASGVVLDDFTFPSEVPSGGFSPTLAIISPADNVRLAPGTTLLTGQAFKSISFNGEEMCRGAVTNTLRLRAYIDGRSRLVLRPNSIRWEHFDYARPGEYWGPQRDPTVLNDYNWIPAWPNDNNRAAGPSFELPATVRFTTNDVALAVVQARHQARIVEQPGDTNNCTLTVELDDNPPPGPDWYEIELSGVFFSTNAMPEILVNSAAEIALVSVNGSPVDALDAAGNFFDAVEIRSGVNVFEVVATDALNQRTTNTVTVYGTTCPQNFASLGEVSASVVPEYGRTSFNEWTKVLYADLALRNAGTYPIQAPFYVGVTRISDPSVRLLSPDGVSADGIPYYDYSAALANGALDIGHSSLPRALAFHNPNHVQFTYDLVILGQLNHAPYFTTAPILEAIVGRPYTYAFNATDPDGDLLTYALLSAPTGMVLNAQLSTLNFQPSTYQLGTHDVRLRTDDGKGGIAEQHYILNVINPPSNRPPYFVSKPVTVARIAPPPRKISLDFEALSPFTQITNQYSQWGVVFNNTGPFAGQVVDFVRGDYGVLDFGTSGKHAVHVGGIGQAVTIAFRNPLTGQPGTTDFCRVRAGDGDRWSESFLFTAFGASGNAIHQQRFDTVGGTANGGVTIELASSGIAKIELRSLGGEPGGSGFAFGDLEFQEVDFVPFYRYDADAIDPDDNELTYAFATSSRYSDAVLKENPVGYWRLGESRGTIAVDSSMNGNHGAYVGNLELESPGGLNGDSNTSVLFGGGRVEVPDAPMHRPPVVTLEAWVKGAPLQYYGPIVMKAAGDNWNDGYGLFKAGIGNTIYFYVNHASLVTVGATLPAGRWNHVVGTYDGTTVRLFINGQQVDSRLFDGALYYFGGSRLMIGAGPGDFSWNGGVDEVAIYDKVLSAETIRGHFEAGRNGAPAAPEGMTIDARTGLIRWNPTAAQIGTHNVSVEVHDGRGGSDTQSYVVCVLPDLTPVFSPESVDLSVSTVDTHELRFDGQALTVSGTVSATIANEGSNAIRRPFEVTFFEDRNNNGAFDSSVDNVLGRTFVSDALPANSEVVVTTPVSGVCRFAGIPVWAFVDSAESVLETNESNNAGRNACESAPPVREFNPVVKWKKDRFVVNPESDQVIMTPAVADLDGDGIPEIIFSSYDFGNYNTNGLLRAIRGTDGTEVWTMADPTNRIIAAAGLAVGDIDNDGQPEIVAVHTDTSLIAFEHDGSFKWKSAAQIGTAEGTIFPHQWGAPSLADFDRDGRPEIVFGAMVFDADGSLRWRGRPGSGKGNFGSGYISTVVDLDLDGVPEVLAGNTAYRADGTIYWTSYIGDGFTAVGNFDNDPFPEIALIGGGGRLNLLNHNGTIQWQRLPPNVGTGAPIVADLDGDGRPEIGLVTPVSFDVYDSLGVPKWSKPTSDQNSGVTGASAFDFDGDGRTEVIYSDDESLLIFRGSDGEVLFRLPKSSCTCTEYPVIADVNGDGSAEIVTVANTTCGWGAHQGIRLNGIYVIGDSNNTWVSTRKIWNQHGYHIDNVNDDGTIPRQETNSWLTHNTYRLNLPLPDDLTAPDLVPSYVTIIETNGTAIVTARIGNAGSKAVLPGIQVAVYSGVPSGRPVLGTASTAARISPGGFEDITFTLGNRTATDIWIVADDDGTGLGQVSECNETNNSYRSGLSLPLDNHPPVITSVPVTNASEGLPYAYLVQATDPDAGDTLSFSLDVAPEGMTIGTATGRIDWTSQAADNGTHIVQVTVADSRGARGFQLFFVTVTNRLNAAPMFVSQPVTSAQAAESYFYFALAMDAENDSLAYDLITRPEGMIVETNTGVVAWRPLLGQLGVHDVVLRVSDGKGGVALQSWQVTVVPPNSAPVFTTLPPSPAVAGLPWQYHVRAQDAEGQALTFQLASNAPTGMALNAQLLQWTPTLAQLDLHPIEILVRDEAGAEARQTFDLEVVAAAPNRAPQFVSAPRTQTRLNAPYSYAARAADADGDPLVFSLVSGPVGLHLTPALSPSGEGVLQWTPQELGMFPVVLTVSDGRVGSVVTQAFTITVSSTLSNAPPLIASQPSRNATAGQPYEYNPSVIDPDDDPVTWRLVSGPVGMSFDSTSGALRWTPTLDQLGTNFVTLEVQDALLATDVQTWAIEVGCLNRPPQITSVPPTAAQTEEPYLYAIRASDPDGDTVTLSFADTNAFPVPNGMTLSNLVVGTRSTASDSNPIGDGVESVPTGIGAALIRWTPATNQAGTYTIRLRATDNRGGNDTQTYYLYVDDLRANKSPVIVSTPARGATVGRPYTYTVRATDPDGDTLTLSSLIDLPAGASFTPSGSGQGVLGWTPSSTQLGPHEFILAASDPAGASAAQRFFVTVRSNQPPVITSTPRTNAVPGATYRYDLIASDPDGDALAYAFTSPVPSGMTMDSLGRMAWTPSAGQLGSFAITVSASDGFGASASQSFRLNVLADTEPPQISLSLVQGLVDPATGQWAGNLGDTVRVRVDAVDNVGVAARFLYRGTNSYPLDATFTASIPVTSGGLFSLDGVAVDFAGNSNTTSSTILFRDPNATNQIFVQIHTPTNGARLTGLAPIRATITNAVDIVSWSWGYALASDVNLSSVVITDPAFTIMGTTNVPPGIRSLEDILIGTFDPTALQNDAYVIAVAATDANGNTWTEPVIVNVEGNLKFGEFRLEFTDLAIPVAGIPITITRVYDTRDARRVGDFGHGWSLGVQDAKIRKTLVDQGWGPTMFPGSRVYITKPDGQRVGFTTFAERQACFGFCFADVGLRPDAGVQDRLAIVDNSATFYSGMFLGGLADSPYSPTAFRLTTKEGTVYSYEENIGLTNVTDLNGNRLEYTRDGIFHYNAGSATSDQSVRFVRDTRGRIRQIIDPNGKALTYSYDGAGDLRSFADQATNTTRYFYSASRAHFLTNIVDPLGRSALGLEYDSTGRLKTVRDANGNPVSQDFDPTTKAATFTDGNGTVIHTRFDDNGNETYRRIDGVYTNTFAYDANNNLLASTNGRGFSTNYTYDVRGNVTSIRDSLGNLTTIAYNDQSKPVGVTNALGQKLILSYSASGQLTLVVNNAGFKTSVSRDAQGRVVSLTDATGTNTTIFDYSNGCACGRPGKVINPDGSFRLYEYNSQGLTNRIVNELSAETLFHHDDAGRLLWMRDPLTNFTYFFYNGPLLTNVVDALGRSTRYEYDALNRTNRIIDAEGGIIEFRYDNNGNRTHVIDAVTNVTTFVYDSANRLTQQIDPLGHTNFFAYDAAGNRIEAIDRNGRKRTFSYDAVNRMTNELWWEGTNVVRSIVFGFNELGVQTLAADPAARYEYSYDALNRLERVLAQSAGVPDFTLLYTYTALGQVESVTDNWGVRAGSGYDNRNRLASRTWSSTLPGAGVDPARVDFAYDVSGNRLRTDRFADLAGANRIGFTTNAYNRAGIVTNITHLGPASQVLAKYDYNFDAAFQITRWAIGNQLSDFAYDRTGQLTNALNSVPGGQAQPDENFRFDANGNRVGAQSYGQYVVGGNNQILSDGTNRYAYDAEGNMTSRSNAVTGVLTTYQFDHRNRLVNVTDRDGSGVVTQTVAFVYDAMNRRLSKTVNGQTTRFLYNGDDSWADLDGANAVIARYLHGARIDELLARQRAGDGRSWYLTDHLGTVRDLANAAGAVVAHVDYSSFGQVLGVSNPAAVDRFLFTGRELDGETGLYFYRARYYSAEIGRFICQDPLHFQGGDANLYRYVFGVPINLTDPSGQLAFIERLALRGLISGLAGALTAPVFSNDPGSAAATGFVGGFLFGLIAPVAALEYGVLVAIVYGTGTGVAQNAIRCALSAPRGKVIEATDYLFGSIGLGSLLRSDVYWRTVNFVAKLVSPCG